MSGWTASAASPSPDAPVRIRIANSPREFDCGPGESLLDAALAAGFNLPHSCRGGNCGACRALKLDGEVQYPNGPPLGLSATEAAEGHVLLCQARPRSDVRLELQTVQRVDQVEVRRLPCRVDELKPLNHDVMYLRLRLPAAEPLAFRSGQYIDILLPQGRRRSFSIASPGFQGSQSLELLVRRVPGGLFSERVWGGLKAGALLEIEGPFGQLHLREEPPVHPILLIGGGTGVAPLLGIARHLVQKGYPHEVRLYWGVRSEHDLFSWSALEHWVDEPHDSLHCEVVLSEPGESWPGRRGWVHEAALEDLGTALVTRGFEVYAAGPPAMIGALRAALRDRGFPADRLHVDVFDYAVDGPRVASTAARIP